MTNNNKIQLSNTKSSQDYEDYLKEHIQKYVVSIFLGRGQYEKTWFFSLVEAQRHLKMLKERDNDTRAIIYGVSKPPHTTLPVNVTMENM